MSNYPESLDTEQDLLIAHDALRLRLTDDYTPGDTSINVEGDIDIYNNFPNTGYITLTEQCSDVDNRAISFNYTSKSQESDTSFTFSGLSLLSAYTDIVKPKKITNVTQNVMAEYHNALKDAIIAIENFVGIKGTIDLAPYGDTMEGRINFLHRLVLQPRAWFSADKTIGLVPFKVTFSEKSFNMGGNWYGTDEKYCLVSPTVFEWDFGDYDCSMISCISHISCISTISSISCAVVEHCDYINISGCPETISVASVVPVEEVRVKVLDIDGGNIVKTYISPGKYDVSFTVRNKYGTDTVTFYDYIQARIAAPDEAIIEIDQRSGQDVTQGYPSGGPFITTPSIKTPVDVFVDLSIAEGENPNTPGVSYGGELLDAQNNPLDPIVDYNWQLSDDLTHGNARSTRASYSVGGLYDLILRVDTEYGAYRITTYEDAFDVVERENLWLWIYSGGQVTAREFGLISETFKTRSTPLTVSRNTNFLADQDNAEQLIREFKRNTFFSPRSTTTSGAVAHGTSLLFWAGGRDAAASPASEKIKIREFNGFDDIYITPGVSSISRPWNWVGMNIYSNAYFILGNTTDAVISPDTSPTNAAKLAVSVSDLSSTSTNFEYANYLNGADELQENVANYDPTTGEPNEGHFSVYRAATKNNVGYFARNDGVGSFFRIKSFYRTEGIISNPLRDLKKLTDIAGTTKLEGQLVGLTSGIYFLNNSANISAYNNTSGVWETGGAGTNSVAFGSLQDKNIAGFGNLDQPLLAVSDDDRRAYMSFDYSPNAFIKFNEADLTFSSLGTRPSGDQWMMTIY